MATLSGKALVIDEGPASKVFVWDWDTGDLVSQADPAPSGSWTVTVPSGKYGVTIRGVAGVGPAAHGPYEV